MRYIGEVSVRRTRVSSAVPYDRRFYLLCVLLLFFEKVAAGASPVLQQELHLLSVWMALIGGLSGGAFLGGDASPT